MTFYAEQLSELQEDLQDWKIGRDWGLRACLSCWEGLWVARRCVLVSSWWYVRWRRLLGQHDQALTELPQPLPNQLDQPPAVSLIQAGHMLQELLQAAVSNEQLDQGGAWCACRHAEPPSLPMPGQACLPGSGVPHDSPLVGHSLWDFALTTPGSARSYVFNLMFQRTTG